MFKYSKLNKILREKLNNLNEEIKVGKKFQRTDPDIKTTFLGFKIWKCRIWRKRPVMETNQRMKCMEMLRKNSLIILCVILVIKIIITG